MFQVGGYGPLCCGLSRAATFTALFSVGMLRSVMFPFVAWGKGAVFS